MSNEKEFRRTAVLDRILWTVGTAVALLACHLLCGHIFYELYGNKDWPIAMFILGLTVILIAAFPNAKKVMAFTVTGYAASFIAGIVFNFEYLLIIDGVLQDIRYTAWQIWTVSFLIFIAAGVIWEIFSGRISG